MKWLVVLILAAALIGVARAQDPATSADHPPGNVNELTLAGLRPGQSHVADAVARWGDHWHHPSKDEQDLYIWCDAHGHLRVQLEVQGSAHTVEVVTVERLDNPPSNCTAALPAAIGRTGRGVRLGDPPARLKAVYGKPFFAGPSSWRGHGVELIVFNFSWAGENAPQILESSFASGHLVKMTLSAQYY